MADESEDGDSEAGDEGAPSPVERHAGSLSGRFSDLTNAFIHAVELTAAAVFALLFAIGVVDLSIQILEAAQSGSITDPRVVIGFIDTGLLLLIIVEVYQTVVAYTEESETRRIVRLVIYTGVIAMVRKAIIFRTGEYADMTAALNAALAYTVLIFGLVGLLFAERVYGESLSEAVGGSRE